jgi:DNA-binding winged helix-turn-helix (wHTH) protein
VANRVTAYLLGDYSVDAHARRLVRADGVDVELQGRAFDVLLVLLQHRGRVVGRRELLDAVWSDNDVTDAALSQALSLVRRALGADGHRLIRTIPGHGYRIDSPPSVDAPVSETTGMDALVDTAPVSVLRRAAWTPRRPWQAASFALVAAIALLAAMAVSWRLSGERGRDVADASGQPSAALVPGHPSMRIGLRLASGAPEDDAWTLDALRGVLRTGLHGNADVRVDDGTESGNGSSVPTLLGVVRMEPVEAVPRQVFVDWAFTTASGATRRWRDRAPADRMFDLADRMQKQLREVDPALALIGAGRLSGAVPPKAQMHFAQGVGAQADHRHADAASEFEAALQRHPGFLVARIELANALIEQGYRAAAMTHLREAERSLAASAGADAMALRARSLSLARDQATAAGLYDRLAAEHPDVLPWRLAGAQAHALSGNGASGLALLAPIDAARLSVRSRIAFHKVRSLAAMAAGDADRSLEDGRRAVAEALRLGEPELEAEAQLNLAGLHYRRAEIADALRVGNLAVAAGDRGRSRRWRYEARQFRAALMVLDDRPVPQVELNALLNIARSSGDIYREGAVQLILANERYRRLDLEGAIAHRRRALSLLERSGDRNGADTALQTLFALERLHGDRERALGLLQRLQARSTDSPLDRWQLEFEFARGEIWTGQLAAATTRLRRTIDAIGAEQQAIGRASLLCLLGQAEVLSGEPERALRSLDACEVALEPAAASRKSASRNIEHTVLRARADAWRAIAAAGLGRPQDVARRLQAMETRLRPLRDYRAMEAFGELALAAGLVGEPAQARPLLAWVAQRREANVVGLPRALLRRGECALWMREGKSDVPQCVDAEAAAMRIEHPMLRLDVRALRQQARRG